jgi:alpha-amylase/alpha-mannosidase (GH57 family)
MPPTQLMILWHMHQPYYKDLVENRYAMPWVRLHTLKDYYGMVAMLKDFPTLHMTFNLVPSLVSQILDYANDTAHEEAYDLAFKPVSSLSPEEKEKLVKYAFQVNHENLLHRHPRFWELFERAKGSGADPCAGPISSPQELLDLQVLSQVAWFDEIYLAGDPEISVLAARQHGYSEEDKRRLRKKEIEIFKVTLEEYKSASARGQIEISTSPYYHPILPLLCDTQAGAESSPGLELPRKRFCHPEDARDQLREAARLHEAIFGRRPVGLWPSEGSVSAEALGIAAQEGFLWAATDEGVLGRSLHTFFHRHGDGTVQDGQKLYVPYRFGAGDRSISLFFRDHHISDLIGFVYSRMEPEAAAQDLLSRIRASAGSVGGGTAVVSLILDGENAWEYFPQNGREFLKRFYSLLASQPDIQTVTPSEILAASKPEPLPHLTPGSWIHANFNVWIGAEEDNRAWDLLSDARDFFSGNAVRPGLDPGRAALARQELWIAEGSDWCWWYGPEHSTANDDEFDELYRKHLGNVYRLLGGEPPDDLLAPIKRPRTAGYNIPPSDLIYPVIDGRETTYFEWLGAGVYMPDARSGSMHSSSGYIRELFYGHNDTEIYLRFDLKPEFLHRRQDFQVRINFQGERRMRLHAAVSGNALGHVELWQNDQPFSVQSGPGQDLKAAYQSILEFSLAYTLLGLAPHEKASIQVSFWVNQLPVQVLPREGWLTLEVAEGLLSW